HSLPVSHLTSKAQSLLVIGHGLLMLPTLRGLRSYVLQIETHHLAIVDLPGQSKSFLIQFVPAFKLAMAVDSLGKAFQQDAHSLFIAKVPREIKSFLRVLFSASILSEVQDDFTQIRQ